MMLAVTMMMISVIVAIVITARAVLMVMIVTMTSPTVMVIMAAIFAESARTSELDQKPIFVETQSSRKT
jgi:hypothetical protein